jgi:ATP/maltotriose-dependent transcriptional regulator MalT
MEWALAMGDRARTRHEVRIVESALSVVRSAMAVLPDGGSPEVKARVRLLEAQLLVIKGDYGAAGHAAVEAATLAEEAGLLPLVATARLTEAWIYNWTGEGSMDDFTRVCERAVDACRRAGDVPGEIEARHVQSNVQFASGHLTECAEINERLIDQAREIGDAAHEALITVRLVAIEALRGNTDRSGPVSRRPRPLQPGMDSGMSPFVWLSTGLSAPVSTVTTKPLRRGAASTSSWPLRRSRLNTKSAGSASSPTPWWTRDVVSKLPKRSTRPWN